MAKDKEDGVGGDPTTEVRPEQRRAERRSSGEIIIEIALRGGGPVLFDPIQELLRGRWSRQEMPSGMSAGDSGLDACPDIPGMCVALDVAGQTARIFDPLGLPANSERLGRINQVFRGAAMQPVEPTPEKRFNLRNQHEVATWLYYMRRLVLEYRYALHVPGSASLGGEHGLAEGLPGDPQIDWYASQFGSPKTKSEMDAALTRARMSPTAAVV